LLDNVINMKNIVLIVLRLVFTIFLSAFQNWADYFAIWIGILFSAAPCTVPYPKTEIKHVNQPIKSDMTSGLT